MSFLSPHLPISPSPHPLVPLSPCLPIHPPISPSSQCLHTMQKIIVPLDVADYSDAIALVEKLSDVTFFKVGLELFTNCGPKIIEALKSRQKNIFLDLKFHDIPNTVKGACRSAARYGVDLLTIHAAAGKDALQAATEGLSEGAARAGVEPPKLIAITLLTSISSRQLAFDLKIPLELPEYALQMALLAKESGLDGAVCSPQEVAKLRDVCGDDFLFVCPGIRPSWADKGDQKRTFTPAQAMLAGADYLVIGRPITAAEQPALAWKKVCEELSINN